MFPLRLKKNARNEEKRQKGLVVSETCCNFALATRLKKQYGALIKNLGPFVYRLGREIFIL